MADETFVQALHNTGFLSDPADDGWQNTFRPQASASYCHSDESARLTVLPDDGTQSLRPLTNIPPPPPMSGEEAPRTRAQAIARYLEKKARRVHTKRIRYQMRKLNADRRPRVKGRFVKREEAAAMRAAGLL